MNEISEVYQNRFNEYENKKRNGMWEVLCADFFQQFISKDSVVMDIGAGYCEFINNINCGKKIAVDYNPDAGKYAARNVEMIITKASKIPKRFNNKIDVIFLSNFLEHLKDKDEVLEILQKINLLLKEEGLLIILSPNISLTKEAYWDFIDHRVPLNENSLTEALAICGFKILRVHKRFLPYTTKSRYLSLVSKWVVKVYLSIPYIMRPFAGQSLIISSKQLDEK